MSKTEVTTTTSTTTTTVTTVTTTTTTVRKRFFECTDLFNGAAAYWKYEYEIPDSCWSKSNQYL